MLKPEPEDAEKIKLKLENGIAASVKAVVRKPERQVRRGEAVKRRETKLSPERPLVR